VRVTKKKTSRGKPKSKVKKKSRPWSDLATPTGRAMARHKGGFAVWDLIELQDLVRAAACSAVRLIRGNGESPVGDEIATKVRDVLFVLADAMGDDDVLDELHKVALKKLASGARKKDIYGARFRLKKGGAANLRAAALELASMVKGPGKLNPDGPNTKMLAILAGQLGDGAAQLRRITPEELCAAFPRGWTPYTEENAERLLALALRSKKAARNAMQGAEDMRAKRRAARG
jgi:hypothetical protein